MNRTNPDHINISPTAAPRDDGRTGVCPDTIPMTVDDRGEKERGGGSRSRVTVDCIRYPSKLMAAAGCGSARVRVKDPSDVLTEAGGILGRAIGKQLVDSEGEIGGEHLVLQAGQFLFDDNHWKSGEQRDTERLDLDAKPNAHLSDGQSRNSVHNKALFLDFWQVQNYV